MPDNRMLLSAIASGLVVGISLSLFIGQPENTATTRNGFFNVDGVDATTIQLTHHNGNKLDWSHFSGTNRLVYFGYTYCPDVCPTELAQMTATGELLDKQGFDVTQLFVTIDPTRDSSDILREYTALFDEALIGLNAEAESLKKLTSAFKVQYRRASDTGEISDYLMDHTSRIFFVATDGEVLGIFDSSHSINDVVQKIVETSLLDNR